MGIISVESNFIFGLNEWDAVHSSFSQAHQSPRQSARYHFRKMEEVFMPLSSKRAGEQLLVLEGDRAHTEDPHLPCFLQELILCAVSENWLTLK